MYTHELHKNPELPQLLVVYNQKQKVAEEIKTLKVSAYLFALLIPVRRISESVALM